MKNIGKKLLFIAIICLCVTGNVFSQNGLLGDFQETIGELFKDFAAIDGLLGQFGAGDLLNGDMLDGDMLDGIPGADLLGNLMNNGGFPATRLRPELGALYCPLISALNSVNYILDGT
jgi:hypothetical protein